MAFVIPFFIPHQGCPHQCLFCNQNSISGAESKRINLKEEIEKTVVTWLARRLKKQKTQFAFYGGSFTCLARSTQELMLEAVQPWIQSKDIDAIRLSTRPDCVDSSTCSFLISHGVKIVEIGVQSLDEKVLESSQRGHGVADCEQAVNYLHSASLQVGIQIMPGLPQETRLSFMQTIKKTIALQPNFVRLYPACVIEGSELADMFKKGEYAPLTLEMAIVLSAWAWRKFNNANIRVVRMGLQASESLKKSLLAGPYHPAFGELVLARDWLNRIRSLLVAHPQEKLEITISSRDISAFVGKRKANLTRLEELGLADRFEVITDKYMERGKIQHVVCKSA